MVESLNSIDLIDRIETHLVPKLNAPIRLQEYGVGIFNATMTKSALKKVLKKKNIKVNNTIATSATYIKAENV